jgi:hypothetical protein
MVLLLLSSFEGVNNTGHTATDGQRFNNQVKSD